MTDSPDQVGPVEVNIAGEFDLLNAPELRELLDGAISSGGNPIVLNMALVTFLDSAALGELIRARNSLPAERRIVLRQVTPHIDKVLRLTGLSSVFTIEG